MTPFPSFSNGLSQTHRAVTAIGQKVAIKFILPGVPERVLRDGRRARAFARLVPSERQLIEEMRVLVAIELDLIRERENIGRLAAATENDPCMRVPRTYPEISTARVLVREDLGGVPVTAVLSPVRRLAFQMENSDFDPHRLAIRLIKGATRQILQQHFDCADVRPQNLLLLPGNTFSFANFTHCEPVDRENSLIYAHFLNDVFSTELPRMPRSYQELLIATSSSNAETMREDFIRESHEWLRSAPAAHRIRSAADLSSPVSNWLEAILRVARRNKFEVPHEMLSVFRTLIDLETIAIRFHHGSSAIDRTGNSQRRRS